jgi:uncharacterized protein YyaL (SSP411 family)
MAFWEGKKTAWRYMSAGRFLAYSPRILPNDASAMHKSHTSDGTIARRNRLAQETSPYLLQHAANPVDWHPWGAEAFELARTTGKPILLSIGYSACHWCHVMAHESFEDEAIAKLMNDLFINIKVDREERPDVDKIYQLAHHVLAQRGGGWPLTMFLTHDDQKPFFGGTYFPNVPRYGMPSFGDLLQRISAFYAQRGPEIRKQNDSLMQVFAETNPPPPAAATQLSDAPFEAARASLLQSFDKEFGGFGGSPKFPHPTNLELLLRRWRASAHDESPDLQSLYAATLTLTRMAEGGIYDQVGGGFCRYSVDRYWMIPHFEKMLYDNGPLLGLYAQAAIATGDQLFKRIAIETAEWIIRDMQAPASSVEGGYWSTLDADSEGHEGKFYVWTPEQVRSLVDSKEYEVLSQRFGLDREANFEGAWHLHAFRSLDEAAQLSGVSTPEAESLLNSARPKLLAVRNQRVWPGRDEKVLVAWNGLAIRGLAIAARSLGDTAQRTRWADSATRALDFIHSTLWKEGRLLAVYKDGQARFPAYVDDYAFLLDALVELLQVRWRPSDLTFATELANALLEHFEDRAAGGFYFTADDAEQLIHRPKAFADEAVPAGNGVAAQALLRLGTLLGDTRYIDAAERTLKAAWSVIERFAAGHASLLVALEEWLEPIQLIVLRGQASEIAEWQIELNKVYAPRRMILAIPADANDLPPALIDKKPTAGGDAVGYVCRGPVCSEPLKSIAALVAVSRE